MEIKISDVISAVGERKPSKEDSQKEFRAAFIYLTAPGTTPSSSELKAIDNIRRAWANEFFFLTKGRGIMETELLEVPPKPVAEHPSIQLGIEYLLSNQRGDGSWADEESTAIRDTSSVVDAFRLFSNDRRAQDAMERGIAILTRLEASSVDYFSRQIASLNFGGGMLEKLNSFKNRDKGWGISEGYISDVYDSALALYALSDKKSVEYILGMQNPDGGWGDRDSSKSQVF